MNELDRLQIAVADGQVKASVASMRQILTHADREGLTVSPWLRRVAEILIGEPGEATMGDALLGRCFYESPLDGGRLRWRKRPEKRRHKGDRGAECGAKTRKGTPCRALSVPGRLRCKNHGGMSTGPRTPEGRERIAESNRRRAFIQPGESS